MTGKVDVVFFYSDLAMVEGQKYTELKRVHEKPEWPAIAVIDFE